MLNVCDDSKLNRTLGLISRRSNNNSFIDLMQTLNVVVKDNQIASKTLVTNSNSNNNNNSNSSRIHVNNKKNIMVGSLCSLTKRIENDISNTHNKFIISPKLKMFLSNSSSKTKLSEFKHSKMQLLGQASSL